MSNSLLGLEPRNDWWSWLIKLMNEDVMLFTEQQTAKSTSGTDCSQFSSFDGYLRRLCVWTISNQQEEKIEPSKYLSRTTDRHTLYLIWTHLHWAIWFRGIFCFVFSSSGMERVFGVRWKSFTSSWHDTLLY